jgi:hypothetical protein
LAGDERGLKHQRVQVRLVVHSRVQRNFVCVCVCVDLHLEINLNTSLIPLLLELLVLCMYAFSLAICVVCFSVAMSVSSTGHLLDIDWNAFEDTFQLSQKDVTEVSNMFRHICRLFVKNDDLSTFNQLKNSRNHSDANLNQMYELLYEWSMTTRGVNKWKKLRP